MNERTFQKKFIERLKQQFPGCVILKNDPDYIQGIPDLLILFNNKWAALEVKRTKMAHHQPNQDYYIEKLGMMSYASFVYPENEEDVLNELQQAFKS